MKAEFKIMYTIVCVCVCARVGRTLEGKCSLGRGECICISFCTLCFLPCAWIIFPLKKKSEIGHGMILHNLVFFVVVVADFGFSLGFFVCLFVLFFVSQRFHLCPRKTSHCFFVLIFKCLTYF
jgi:hypothetical protein